MIGSSFSSIGHTKRFQSSQPLIPSDINGLAMWVDPSDTSSIATVGSYVTGVTDKAGNYTFQIKNNLYSNVYLNNHLGLYFNNGANLITGSGPIATNGNHFAVMVTSWRNVNNARDSLWSFNGTRSYAVQSSASNNTFPGELDYGGTSGTPINNSTSTNSFTNSISRYNNYHIISVVFNKTGNQIYHRLNGILNSSTHSYNNSLPNNCTDFRIYRNRSGQKMDGDMHEFIMYNTLPGTGGTDITYLQQIEGYLAHKFALQSQLPNGHPYKNNAP